MAGCACVPVPDGRSDRMAGSKTLPLDQDGSARFLPWLIGLMVFLAALVTGVGFAIDVTLIRWDDGMRGTLTVQLPQPLTGGALAAASVDQALTLLRGTAGVSGASGLAAPHGGR